MTAKKFSLLLLLILAVLFIIAVSVTAVFKNVSGVRIVERSILVINLENRYPERTYFQFGFKQQMPFYKLLRSIYAAADDSDIESILLKGYSIQGLSRTWEIARALRHFRQTGKPVYGYFEFAGSSNLLLSSLCDTVSMPPQGQWTIPGVRASMLFLRGTFEKLGIGFDVIQLGKYKGAAEMFTNDSMSAPLRESYDKLLDDLYGRFTADCSQEMGVPVDSVKKLIDSAILQPNEALNFGIIDNITFWRDLKEKLVGDDDDRFVSVNRYANTSPPWDDVDKKIALVIADGTIVPSGLRWSQAITDIKYTKILRELAEDDDIDAIVLRVNSPGGSALASDNIHREIELAAGRKPLFVSMGSVAASGGYYISMAADNIVATPYTITGSIGVIMMKPHYAELYDKIGAKSQFLKRGKFADIFSGNHRMRDNERELFEKVLGEIYEQFVSKAATGRDTSFEWIDSVGQGRIWSAIAADSLALIDTLGSLWDAIELAEHAVGVPEGQHAKLIVKPRPGSFLDFASSFTEISVVEIVPSMLREKLYLYELAEHLAAKPLYLWPGDVQCD